MEKRGAREIVFVCCGLKKSNELMSDIIVASDQSDASKIFYDLYNIKPQDVLGPFYKKKTQILENTRILKFANETKKAIYNDWKVNAFMLKEPEDHAYLIFINRIDNRKMSPPTGTIVVPISCLRFEK